MLKEQDKNHVFSPLTTRMSRSRNGNGREVRILLAGHTVSIFEFISAQDKNFRVVYTLCAGGNKSSSASESLNTVDSLLFRTLVTQFISNSRLNMVFCQC